jgi:hypothetical protein
MCIAARFSFDINSNPIKMAPHPLSLEDQELFLQGYIYRNLARPVDFQEPKCFEQLIDILLVGYNIII